MKSMPSPGSSFRGIEPLEARIAPAGVIIRAGIPETTQDTEYSEEGSPFVNTELAPATDLIAQMVGGGEVDVKDTFYLKMSAGDVLKIFNTTNGLQDYLKVKSGTIVAFFVDKDLDDEIEEGELVSISMGKNASFEIAGQVEGDVVANLNDAGDALLTDLPDQALKNVKFGGSVLGKIIAGGDISKISADGSIGAILAGSAVNRLNPAGEAVDYYPGVVGGDSTVSFTPKAGQKGSSVSNIFVDGIGTDVITGDAARIEAGGGGSGATGGAIKNIRLLEDASGFSILAGAGGAAAEGKTKGGAGGAVSKVYVAGFLDSTPRDHIQIAAGVGGAGGDADIQTGVVSSGVGGKGGSVSSVFVGYQFIGTKLFPTLNLLADTVSVEAGAGGAGKIGGAGGGITKVDLLTSTPEIPENPEGPQVLLAAVQGTDELSLIAGDGGAGATDKGKAGVGGSITNVKVRDVLVEGPSITLTTGVLLQAGNGGNTFSDAAGANGGSISNARMVGAEMNVIAGNGSSGKIGGTGGSLKKIVLDVGEGVVPHVGVFNAGAGGDASKGAAGRGGSINNVRNETGDFVSLDFNLGTAGNGGSSATGVGAAGGSVTNLNIFDGDTGRGDGGMLTLRAGDGGNGLKGGGKGGSLTKSQLIGLDLSFDVFAGAGGNAAGEGAKGAGGAGGDLKAVQVLARISTPLTSPDALLVEANLTAGAGGAGAGAKGSGGSGGMAQTVNLNVDGSASIHAGDGGNGDERAAGAGGDIIKAGAFAVGGSAQMLAGNAGVEGAGPANGGSIRGTSSAKLSGLYASVDVEAIAGDGSNGGAGGGIKFLGYGSTSSTLEPTPRGNITISAGDGSASGKFAGAGGSLENITGSVASGDASMTLIAAGNGSGSSDRSSSGGSIKNLNLFLGGAAGSELRIKAGDAGNGGARGANGGDIQNVSVSAIDDGTIFRSVAAGNGGSGSTAGGDGGSVTNLRVLDHDIGVRMGQMFGYETMGGIFAGAAGAGPSDGKAGSVSGVTASAIAAIVAGRDSIPQLVERVEKITLYTPQTTGLPATNLLRASEGDLQLDEPVDETGGDAGYHAYVLSAYMSANLVGASYAPDEVDGNMFHYEDGVDSPAGYQPDLDTPIDGLIAAKVFDQATVNFTPEARLIGTTLSSAVLYDYNNLV